MDGDLDKKRKRDSGVTEDDLSRPSKRSQSANGAADESVLRTSDANKGGQARQLKSERRNKKALEAKKNSVQKQQKASTGTSDTLASGQDYIPLNDKAAIPKKSPKRAKLPPQAATIPFQRKEEKAKKSSPRSMRKAAKAEKISKALEEEGLAGPTAATATATTTTGHDKRPSSDTSARFICFVGNLPYTATTAQIETHFSKLAPKAIRHSTDKATGKSKGFAFLEFENYDRMKTCLQSYHQSIFEPEQTAARDGEVRQAVGTKRKTQGRKLNVELTAGGGGNTQDRKQKIREKNNKLKEERSRKKLGEKQQLQEKLKKRREQSEKAKAKTGSRGATGANAEVVPDGRGDIHPSRLARVPIEV